jgi:Zn-dependent peptidase ImmA (M78 family)
MNSFTKFRKSLKELQRIADQVKRVHDRENPLEVDIERTLETYYGLKIDVVALDPACGVEAFLNLTAKTIFLDVNLIDLEYNERRYRFTLGEELGHFILHKELFQSVSSIDDYLAVYKSIPDDDFNRFEMDAKALAGMILAPEQSFIERLILHRDSRLKALGKSPGAEALSVLVAEVNRELMQDFNISFTSVRHRLRTLLYLHHADFFTLKPEGHS